MLPSCVGCFSLSSSADLQKNRFYWEKNLQKCFKAVNKMCLTWANCAIVVATDMFGRKTHEVYNKIPQIQNDLNVKRKGLLTKQVQTLCWNMKKQQRPQKVHDSFLTGNTVNSRDMNTIHSWGFQEFETFHYSDMHLNKSCLSAYHGLRFV